VVLLDHSAAAEAALVALGGAPSPCFEVLRSWRARAAWERALEPRGPGFHQLYRRPPLPRPLAGPLELGIARGWERRAARGERGAMRLLETATRGRAEPALRTALASALQRAGALGARVDRCEVLVTTLSAPDVTGRISAKEAAVTVRVTTDWYRSVGAPRAALDVDGRFVVARSGRAAEVLVWEERSPGRWSAVVRRDPPRSRESPAPT
jgi:hypothetical protein